MPHEFNEAASVHMNRDDSGVVRDLLHIEEPFVSRARTPQLAAREYLEKFGGLLGISADQLQNFGLHPEARPVEAKVEYRLLDEKTQFDTTTVIFSQTCFGLPVWEAAVAVHLQHDPLRVVSAQSTIQNVIADAEMMLGAARCYVFHAMEREWTRLENNEPRTIRERADVRTPTCECARSGYCEAHLQRVSNHRWLR